MKEAGILTYHSMHETSQRNDRNVRITYIETDYQVLCEGYFHSPRLSHVVVTWNISLQKQGTANCTGILS